MRFGQPEENDRFRLPLSPLHDGLVLPEWQLLTSSWGVRWIGMQGDREIFWVLHLASTDEFSVVLVVF